MFSSTPVKATTTSSLMRRFVPCTSLRSAKQKEFSLGQKLFFSTTKTNDISPSLSKQALPLHKQLQQQKALATKEQGVASAVVSSKPVSGSRLATRATTSTTPDNAATATDLRQAREITKNTNKANENAEKVIDWCEENFEDLKSLYQWTMANGPSTHTLQTSAALFAGAQQAEDATEYRQAAELCEMALKLQPGSLEMCLKLADLHADKLRDYPVAMKWYRRASVISPGNTASKSSIELLKFLMEADQKLKAAE